MNPLAKYLTDYLLHCNKLEISAQAIRQSLASNPYFQVVSVFKRFDKFRKGYLEPADFSQFMLENQVYPSEPELYLIFKDFDKYKKGVVHLQDFQAQILPREHSKLRKSALQRQPYPVQLRLSLDLQYLLARYFQDKIKTISVLNQYRTRIRLIKPSAVRDAFKLIDTRSAGYIMRDEELDTFLRSNGKALNE